jgi:hypothetical protein
MDTGVLTKVGMGAGQWEMELESRLYPGNTCNLPLAICDYLGM